MKALLIKLFTKFIMFFVAIGIGIWYLSSSISGSSLTYTSMDNFLTAIGNGNGDLASTNGCFFCGYIYDLFEIMGRATEMFWSAMVDNLWIIMVVGFGIYMFIHSGKYLYDTMKKTGTLDTKEKKLEFQPWFDPIWQQAIRLMFVGVFMGALGLGGIDALKTITNIIITPVLYVGAVLSMAATNVGSFAQCNALTPDNANVFSAILSPMMCIIGNLNTVMLAGASGGFALMNYAWLGMGAGLFTWLSGLSLVLLFLFIGFNLFFQVLSVLFKLVFLIIFLPFILAAAAFEQTWSLAKNVLKNSINMVVSSAIKIIGISLKIIIVYAAVSFGADEFFPGGHDGYSAIMPPLLTQADGNMDAKTLSIVNVFSTCEEVALKDGEMDKDLFKQCFIAKKYEVERKYPGAFDFMSNGWDFFLFMIGIFLLYQYVINKKIDEILPKTEGGEMFDFGSWAKNLGKTIWQFPTKVFNNIYNAVKKDK